ncbi:hypothetical protein ACMFMG_007198 [Clarireedia jacksonii]
MASSVDQAIGELSSISSPVRAIYDKLKDNEIRLVTLLKGQWSEKIQCRLQHVLLANRPSYKALSYAWGSPRATQPILLNDYPYLVTVNLESALRRLRRTNSDLTLWIDAICINQSENEERTAQVSLMHDIFSSTEEVIVYLGEVSRHSPMVSKGKITTSTTTFYGDDNDAEKLDIFLDRCKTKTSSTSLKAIQRLDYAVEIFSFLRLLAGTPSLDQLTFFNLDGRQCFDIKYQENLFEGLRQLMLCRWWKRIWVIQEVVVPRNVTMVYGSCVAPWDMFVNAARWNNHPTTAQFTFRHEFSIVLEYFSRIILDIERMRHVWRNNEQTALLPLLRRFSDRKASDDRDKVYALLSLARNQTSIIPEYSVSVGEVFETTVLDIIKTTKSLAVFAGDLGRKDRQDLPSWVADWSASYDDQDRRRADHIGDYNATSGCQIFVRDIRREYEDACLLHSPFQKKIINFWDPSNSFAYLRNYGTGVIGIPGLDMDRVYAVGETVLSAGDLVVLGTAFRSALCAGRVSIGPETTATRDIVAKDHLLIATRCLRWLESEPDPIRNNFVKYEGYHKFVKDELFHDLENLDSYMQSATIPLDIDNAIQLATIRRRLFITDGGRIGLGPAKMQVGDRLSILLGGHTPFILRPADPPKSFKRHPGYLSNRFFEVVGDAYAHGLMNGEAMIEWRVIAKNAIRKGDWSGKCTMLLV